MHERVRFVAAFLGDEDSVAGLARRFGVSRKTAHKWIARYKAGGVSALEDASRAPRTHPQRISQAVERAVLALKRRHPSWGPMKLRGRMAKCHPTMQLPATSTIGLLLRKHGLVRRRRRYPKNQPHEGALTAFSKPNAVWCIDFKGYFLVGGERFCPLTVTDGFSRFILVAKGIRHQDTDAVKHALTCAFRDYGLPDVIRSDNGTPFSSTAPAGLSALSAWWIRLGIRPERIEKGHPEQNGRHERMHLTLKNEVANPPRTSFDAQQRALERFRERFNNIRPHQALDLRTPSEFYTPSLRALPSSLPELVYPAHFETIRTYNNGAILFQGLKWYLSSALRNETVGLEHCGEDRWRVWFAHICLGVIDLALARKQPKRNNLHVIRSDGQPAVKPRKSVREV